VRNVGINSQDFHANRQKMLGPSVVCTCPIHAAMPLQLRTKIPSCYCLSFLVIHSYQTFVEVSTSNIMVLAMAKKTLFFFLFFFRNNVGCDFPWNSSTWGWRVKNHYTREDLRPTREHDNLLLTIMVMENGSLQDKFPVSRVIVPIPWLWEKMATPSSNLSNCK